MTVWHTLDALVSISVVNQHRARLVLRWPFAGSSCVCTIFGFYQPPRLTQPSYSSGISKMCTSETWGIDRHATRCISPGSLVSQCTLLSGWKLWTWRSASPQGSIWLRKVLYYRY